MNSPDTSSVLSSPVLVFRRRTPVTRSSPRISVTTLSQANRILSFANDKIRFAWDSVVTEILGDDRVTGVRLRNTKTGEESTLEVSGLFIAVGHEPRTELFAGQLELDD